MATAKKTYSSEEPKTYAGSPAMQEAAAKINYGQEAPQYGGQFDQMVNDIYDRIANREKFNYDVNADPLYQSYKDSYLQQGKLAMKDTMGQAAALTGGYGNSYGQQVGQQAYNAYLQNLSAVIPELYGMAYNQYRDEGNDLKDLFGMAGQLRDTDYGRWRDAMSDYNYNRELARLQEQEDYNRAWNEENRAYQRAWDEDERAYNREWNEENRAYTRAWNEDDRRYNREWNEENRAYTRAWDENEREYNRNLTADQLAYQRAWDEENRAYTRAWNEENQAYNRALAEDELKYNRAWNEENQKYTRAWNEDEREYARNQTTENTKYTRGWNEDEREYSRRQQALSNIISLIKSSGYMPTDEELAEAGLTREAADALKAAYELAISMSGSVGGGGGGGTVSSGSTGSTKSGSTGSTGSRGSTTGYGPGGSVLYGDVDVPEWAGEGGSDEYNIAAATIQEIADESENGMADAWEINTAIVGAVENGQLTTEEARQLIDRAPTEINYDPATNHTRIDEEEQERMQYELDQEWLQRYRERQQNEEPEVQPAQEASPNEPIDENIFQQAWNKIKGWFD